jgi:outer membrane protein assembly factor BamE (lipoprotein component of BamABCDE complex)
MKTKMICLLFGLLAMVTLSGCVTLGHHFPREFASQIVIGKTSRQDIETRLGTPFRTGLDSGNPTATYVYYKIGLFSSPITEDMTVTFGPDGKVKSYSFNSNQEE